jgi:hypothetical protein
VWWSSTFTMRHFIQPISANFVIRLHPDLLFCLCSSSISKTGSSAAHARLAFALFQQRGSFVYSLYLRCISTILSHLLFSPVSDFLPHCTYFSSAIPTSQSPSCYNVYHRDMLLRRRSTRFCKSYLHWVNYRRLSEEHLMIVRQLANVVPPTVHRR